MYFFIDLSLNLLVAFCDNILNRTNASRKLDLRRLHVAGKLHSDLQKLEGIMEEQNEKSLISRTRNKEAVSSE